MLRLALIALTAALLNAAPNLDVYWIDTEGGGGTLIVSPSGEGMSVSYKTR